MSFDTLKQPKSNPTNFANFTDEQVDAVVVYLAKIARLTRTEHGLSEEQSQAEIKKFSAIMDSWPNEFRDRVALRIIESNKTKNTFWAVPADAMIAATKAVELG